MEESHRDRVFLAGILAAFFLFAPCPLPADPPVDTDGDGIDDHVEISLGYNPLLFTRIIYVDGAQADDSGNGLTPEAKTTGRCERRQGRKLRIVVVVSPGTYIRSGQPRN